MDVRSFVDRPVLSCVISTFIVLIGLLSLLGLPVEKFPDIAPPTVTILTMYPGASASTIQKSVIMPIEEAVNGVDNMTYIQSSSTNAGNIIINVYFKQGVDPNMAAVNVQNRVAKVTALLPAEVAKMGVAAEKRQPSMLRIFGLCSPDGKYDEKFIANYLHNTVKPAIQRISGVGQVDVFANKYGMRIWLDPDKMNQYKLVPSDIVAVLGDQNIEAPLGTIGANAGTTFQYTMKFRGRRVTEDEFKDIVIKTLPDGGSLRIGDVARLQLDREDYTWSSTANGKNGCGAAVYQVAGSNATDINNAITKLFEEELNLPEGLEVVELENGNDFLYAAMENVIDTLRDAIILVILVVFFFLRDWRATLIPLISIFIALIGTFAFLAVVGWSLNLLTLFSLVLVIGTVVDDSICVVEAVQERFEHGFDSPELAAKDGISSISNALITTTIVFMLVFIPVSFMGGTSGVFYRQFGLTMAVAVGLSAFSAMFTAPALCAILMKPVDESKEGGFMKLVRKAYNVVFNPSQAAGIKGANFFVKHKWMAFAGVAGACVLLVVLMGMTNTGMVPQEDKGALYIDVSAPMATSLDETKKIMHQVDSALATIPEVENRLSIAGQGLISGMGSNFGLLFVKLKPWGERTGLFQDATSVSYKIYMATAHIKGAKLFVITPPMIDGYGQGNMLELWAQDQKGGDIKEFFNHVKKYSEELAKRPEIGMTYCSYDVDYPQYMIDIDAEACQRRGIAPSVVLNTIGSYFGGVYASNFNRFSKLYRVMVQSEPSTTRTIESLNNIFVRMDNGEMAPVSQFIKIQKEYEPMELKRFNLYSAISMNAVPAAGYSSGAALNAVKEVAAEKLPQGSSMDFSGMTREENENGGGNLAFIFGICILFVYLVMAALYESLLIPFAILLSVPVGLMGSFLFAYLFSIYNTMTGGEPINNDIYFQVALIMLIGLLAKTAILLTEYATQCRKAGMTLTQAAMFAAKMRFRPVIMTVLTMVLGMVPMITSTGSGSNGNRTIGVAVIGGMILGTISLVVFVPAMFIVFQWIQEKMKKIKWEATDDQLINHEIDRLMDAGELTLPVELATVSTQNKEEQ